MGVNLVLEVPISVCAGQSVPAFNQHFMISKPQSVWNLEVMKNVIEGLGSSKDKSWPLALSDSSIPVFTF